MFNEEITYEDYNGESRTETFYFHFSKSEAIRMENSVDGGLSEKLKKIVAAKDKPELIKLFESIILQSYGIKSDDGKRFQKSEEISNAFKESPAYDIFLMRLLTEDGYASKFIEAIAPKQ